MRMGGRQIDTPCRESLGIKLILMSIGNGIRVRGYGKGREKEREKRGAEKMKKEEGGRGRGRDCLFRRMTNRERWREDKKLLALAERGNWECTGLVS